MDEVTRYHADVCSMFTDGVFVPHEDYAKLRQALSDSATNTLTICGLRDMAVKRAEEAEAERDEAVASAHCVRQAFEEQCAQLRAEEDAMRKLRAELDWWKKKIGTTMGVGCGFVYGDYESIKAAQAIVFRLENATARIAELEGAYGPRPGVNWCLRSHKQAERICELLLKVASLEAQLSACTKAHYGQMAEEASAGVGGTALKYGKQRQRLCARCLFGERPCANQSKKSYVSSAAGDSCTGFVERPQTQGL